MYREIWMLTNDLGFIVKLLIWLVFPGSILSIVDEHMFHDSFLIETYSITKESI